MKIAIPSCGLEHIQRGYESFSRELFDNFRIENTEVFLFKGSGRKTKNEIVIPSIKRDSRILKIVPKKWEYYKYKLECFSFAFLMLPFLIKHHFDIIHFSDNELGRGLLMLKKRFGFKYKLVFSNGGPWGASECAIFDAVQELTHTMQDQNINNGVDPQKSFYLPYGISVDQYSNSNVDKIKIREQFNLPVNSFIVLSLSALKTTHKRIDWLINEFSKIEGDCFLLMAGSKDAETPKLYEIAGDKLPQKNYRFVTVSYQDVVKLLQTADVMVSCSLSEAFGRVLLEAASSKVPVISHPHYAAVEILKNELSFVDMTIENELAMRISLIKADDDSRQRMIAENYDHAKKTYDWSVLNKAYFEVYKKALGLQ